MVSWHCSTTMNLKAFNSAAQMSQILHTEAIPNGWQCKQLYFINKTDKKKLTLNKQ